MIPSFESDTTRNGALFLMASLSPKVKESIDKELYRATAYSDDSTEEYVLEDAFSNYMKDLETIGLSFNFDYSMYCDSIGLLFSFLRLTSMLLPNSLYDIIRTQSNIRDLLTHIVNGSLGEDETLINVYLSELGGLGDTPAIIPELTDYIDQIYPLVSQTEIFSDYIKNLLVLASEERPMLESDHLTHTAYTNKLKDILGRLSDAVNSFSHDVGYDYIVRIQDFIIRDFLAPVNFHDYTYLLLENTTTLPDSLIEGYLRKWYHYKVSSPWCAQYHILRGITPNDMHETNLIVHCFIYALANTPLQYHDDVMLLPSGYRDIAIEDTIIQLYGEV